jgi:hypothetical protein
MCSLRVCCVVFALLFSPLYSPAQEPTESGEASYLSFEVPGALGTFPMSINNSMAVTGYYLVSPKVARAFLRDAGGAITTFSVRDGVWTEPESINAAGDITGFYEVTSGAPHGFERYADGRIITFDPPCETIGPCDLSIPVSINAFGEIAGNYPYLAADAAAGFTRSPADVFSTIRFSLGADYATIVTGLNSNGTTVGYCYSCYTDNGSNSFLLDPDGFSVQFSVPFDEEIGSEITKAEDINADGMIAGWYFVCPRECATQSTGGFVRSRQGVFTLFNPPGTIEAPPSAGLFQGNPGDPVPSAGRSLFINQEGSIGGSYADSAGAQHGFVRNPYGTITSFDPPRGRQTTATSINDSGIITGSFYYAWDSQTAHGFLRLPQP